MNVLPIQICWQGIKTIKRRRKLIKFNSKKCNIVIVGGFNSIQLFIICKILSQDQQFMLNFSWNNERQ